MSLELVRPDLELALAVIVVTILTLGAYRLGCRFQFASPRSDRTVFLGLIGVSFLFAWSFFGRLIWAEAITSSAALYWSNVTPVVLAFCAGMAGHVVDLRKAFRPVVGGILMTLAIAFVITPIARPVLFPLDWDSPPEPQWMSQWQDGVYMQSNSASCAPAAAVTLLDHAGVKADEKDLASACLSSSLGTAPLGLYRGLSTVAKQHDLTAKVASRRPERWSDSGQLPNVALVRFQMGGDNPQDHGFLGNVSVGHVVTVLGRTDGGRWLIGDPAVGKVSWSDEELRQRFTGEAIYLAK
ncbi:cysteine peptidase family C39 domain-containing protein [Rhodopirellula sp. JC740]|uniref:Cysteine peptidase family C39 domain-containing protein n=1 Tax=Rhodopirellula halodulae TaxID=2894198 RepID=A0ABS8NIT8_9BACT|nr:cysteine peptidase family C39 domain-containing protein [Rhodopirellula sp. JC740]MCC9643469.1 cysteine peptidase family C39 domain-containing protein [Rhodopirellula sp. JC740]